MKRLFVILVLFSTIPRVHATAQAGDVLIWGKDTSWLFSNPLELRRDIDSIRERLEEMGAMWTSTACWRGYIATWEIIGNELYLVNIESDLSDTIEINLEKLLPGEVINGRVRASWVTDTLIVPRGECIFYVHSGYQSVYEKESEIIVQEGNVVKRVDWNNYWACRPGYWENPELLKDFIYGHIDWGKVAANTPERARVVFCIIPSEEIKPVVKIIRSSGSTIFDEEAMKAVQMLEEWETLYQRGKLFRQSWVVPVIFKR